MVPSPSRDTVPKDRRIRLNQEEIDLIYEALKDKYDSKYRSIRGRFYVLSSESTWGSWTRRM